MATSSDIATLALRHIGVIGEDETPTAAANTTCTTAYDRLYAELQEEGFAVWATASIPTFLVEALMLNVAARVRPEFQTVGPGEHAAERVIAWGELVAKLRRAHTRAPVQIEDF